MIQVWAPSQEWKRTSGPSGEMRKNKVAQPRVSGSRSACLSVMRTNMVYLGSCAAQTAPICVTHHLRRSDSLDTRVKGEASVWKWIFTRPKTWIVQFMHGGTGSPSNLCLPSWQWMKRRLILKYISGFDSRFYRLSFYPWLWFYIRTIYKLSSVVLSMPFYVLSERADISFKVCSRSSFGEGNEIASLI